MKKLFIIAAVLAFGKIAEANSSCSNATGASLFASTSAVSSSSSSTSGSR